MNETYFYQFLEVESKELAYVARELEHSIFTNPRTMLTHARIFVETILQKVMKLENIETEQWTTLKEHLDLLTEHGYLTTEVKEALHTIRLKGNQATHQARQIRYSEALITWEAIYDVVKWYVEVYAPLTMEVPTYEDPAVKYEQVFDTSELEERLQMLEKLIQQSIEGKAGEKEVGHVKPIPLFKDQKPGYTTIRTLTYKNQQLDIPYFLRDAFLLPQRFDSSERFLIRLGAEQQARIMSELPDNLENLHKHVTRYNETNDEALFHELTNFVAEEKARRELKVRRPGELFFFYKTDYVVVTEHLENIELTTENFTGFPSFIKQLNEQGFEKVGQLPSELVTLAKYKGVGKGTLEKFFNQLKQQ